MGRQTPTSAKRSGSVLAVSCFLFFVASSAASLGFAVEPMGLQPPTVSVYILAACLLIQAFVLILILLCCMYLFTLHMFLRRTAYKTNSIVGVELCTPVTR